jgi:hypothetical protein
MRDLRVPALRLAQGAEREIYSFGIDGKLLHRFAAVSRVGRDDDAAIRGYQRPEVLSHINAIRAYIESETPMIPNGIVVAFDSRVRFESEGGRRSRRSSAHHGTLIIPLDAKERPGWIVDGQQRAAAIRDARVDRFPIFVNAFITEEVAEQLKDQLVESLTQVERIAALGGPVLTIGAFFGPTARLHLFPGALRTGSRRPPITSLADSRRSA